MTEYSISQKIIRNTFFNVAGRFWGILVAVVLTPYIIRCIGVERFGIWSIIGVLTGYFGLLDFGIGTSFVKYLAEFHTRKEYDKINAVVNTGFAFYFLLTIVAVAFILFFINPLIAFFKIPSYLRSEASFVLMLGVILFCGNNALSPFGAVQVGLQRMDISNIVAIVVSIVNVIGMVFFLKKGYGLSGLMVNNVITFGFSSVLNIIIAFRLLPVLKFNPFLLDKAIFKNLFGFGYKLQISRFANLISFQSDKLLITYFLGVGMVTFYQIGSSLLAQVRQVALLLISALVPAASEIEARKQKEFLNELYLRGSKYLIFVSVHLTLFTMMNASLIISAWMGEGYGKAVLVIQVLAVGYFAATVTGVASSIALGVAKTELDMKFGIFMATLNIVLNIILVMRIGFIGVVIGTSVSLFVASIYYLTMFHQYIKLPLSDFLRLLYKPFLACVIPLAIVGVFNHFILPHSFFSRRIFYLTVLSFDALMFGAAYLFFIYMNRYLDEQDRNLLKNKIPFL